MAMGNVDRLSRDETIIVSTITELKNYHFLTPDHWRDSHIKITDLGKIIIETPDFFNVVDDSYKDISKIFINNVT